MMDEASKDRTTSDRITLTASEAPPKVKFTSLIV